MSLPSPASYVRRRARPSKYAAISFWARLSNVPVRSVSISSSVKVSSSSKFVSLSVWIFRMPRIWAFSFMKINVPFSSSSERLRVALLPMLRFFSILIFALSMILSCAFPVEV